MENVIIRMKYVSMIVSAMASSNMLVFAGSMYRLERSSSVVICSSYVNAITYRLIDANVLNRYNKVIFIDIIPFVS